MASACGSGTGRCCAPAGLGSSPSLVRAQGRVRRAGPAWQRIREERARGAGLGRKEEGAGPARLGRAGRKEEKKREREKRYLGWAKRREKGREGKENVFEIRNKHIHLNLNFGESKLN